MNALNNLGRFHAYASAKCGAPERLRMLDQRFGYPRNTEYYGLALRAVV
jgi:hypothetical protein